MGIVKPYMHESACHGGVRECTWGSMDRWMVGIRVGTRLSTLESVVKAWIWNAYYRYTCRLDSGRARRHVRCGLSHWSGHVKHISDWDRLTLSTAYIRTPKPVWV